MARRQTSDVSDSLELLLDTICNVFGGIILMAVLVVLQTQTSANRLPDPTPDDAQRGLEARRLRFECDRVRTRLEDLKLHREEVEQTFRLTTSPAGERLAGAAQEFQKAIEETQKRLTADERETAEAARTRVQAETLLKNAERLAKEKREELDKVGDRLQHRAATLPQGIRLPHRRGNAAGIPRYYLIKGNKAYACGNGALARWIGDPYPLEDCLVTPLTNAVTQKPLAEIRPRNDAGFTVPAAGGPGDGFVDSLRGCAPDKHYLVFFVYRDSQSYASFQRLKEAAANLHYRFLSSPKETAGESLTVFPGTYHETD